MLKAKRLRKRSGQLHIEVQTKTCLRKSARVCRMTPAMAELIVDIQNVEDALHLRADRKGVLLAAALAVYRRRLEKEGGFVRLRPDPALEWIKYIEIQQGNGWLKLIDTRVAPKKQQ